MEKLSNCPICDSTQFSPFLSCIDYTVSRETFNIVKCNFCHFKFTNPRPERNKLGEYYKSENYISHSNSSKGFINSIYQIVRKYTLLKKFQLISRYYKTGKILDIGCGTGEFLNVFKSAKWDVLGIEPDAETRKNSIEKYGLDVGGEDAIKQLKEAEFDVITMWHVLEHVQELNSRISELKRLLKPNGLIVIAVPNPDSLDAKIYKEHWAAYDLPRHLYHFSPANIHQLFSNHGLSVFKILPMIFDSFYISMLSEKYRTGKSNTIRALWNGIHSNVYSLAKRNTHSSQIYLIKRSTS